jgi:hypothetical protein
LSASIAAAGKIKRRRISNVTGILSIKGDLISCT